MYPLHGNFEMGTSRSARRLNCGNRADWVSHTRAIPPSFNSGWQVNSFPRAFSLPSRNGAIPRGKIDPFPGFPTGSAGSYITDGHLYISNSALRPASFESSIVWLFDLPGIQICWLQTSHRLNDCYIKAMTAYDCLSISMGEHFRKERKKTTNNKTTRIFYLTQQNINSDNYPKIFRYRRTIITVK